MTIEPELVSMGGDLLRPQHSYRRLVTVVSRFFVCNAIRKHGSDLTVDEPQLRELPEALSLQNRLRLHSDLRAAFYGLSRSSQQIVNAFDQFVRALNGLLA